MSDVRRSILSVLLLALLCGSQMFSMLCGTQCDARTVTAQANTVAHAQAMTVMAHCDACRHPAVVPGSKSASLHADNPAHICSAHQDALLLGSVQRLSAPVLVVTDMLSREAAAEHLSPPQFQMAYGRHSELAPGSRFPSLLNIRV